MAAYGVQAAVADLFAAKGQAHAMDAYVAATSGKPSIIPITAAAKKDSPLMSEMRKRIHKTVIAGHQEGAQ